MSSIGLRIKSDKLFFETRNEFEERISQIQSDSTIKKEVGQVVKNQGFISLFTYYKAFGEKELENLVASKDVVGNSNNNYLIAEQLNEPTLVESVDVDEIQLLLNEKRQVQIGEEIYTFNYNEVAISDLKGNPISSERIYRPGKTKGTVVPLKNARGINNYDEYKYFSHNGKDYRIWIELQYTGFNSHHFYKGWSTKIHAKHQKKFLGVYINNNATIVLGGTAQAGVYEDVNIPRCGTGWFNTSKYTTCSNCGDLNFQYTDNVYPCYLDISASAYIYCADGNQRSVSVNEYAP